MNRIKPILTLLILFLLASCTSRNLYSDYDYSYSRSGGLLPVYENFLIKGNVAHYSFEGEGKKIKKDFKVSAEEIEDIEATLTANEFRRIREDYKKVYDKTATTIVVKLGPNTASKSDASYIMDGDQQKWLNVVTAFRTLLDSKLTPAK